MPVYTQWNTNTAAERISVPGQHQPIVSKKSFFSFFFYNSLLSFNFILVILGVLLFIYLLK